MTQPVSAAVVGVDPIDAPVAMDTSVAIGPVQLQDPVVLAPMSGVCNLPFRLLCREHGAALVCSEFVNARALSYGNRKSLQMLRVHPKEHPVSIQIFGSEVADVRLAAKMVEDAGADIVDFNMGCPVPKVIKAEAGAALMRKPDFAQELIAAVVDAVRIPVTVKMRAGWDDTSINVVDLARRFEQVGVAAVAIHPRTREQRYEGPARWEIIAEVKRAVRIPVIGNGDVFSPEDARSMLETTGCDGVMIGRGALGNPWIFRRTIHYLRTGELLPEPGPEERAAVAKRHLQMLAELKGERTAVHEMRQHLAHYIRGFPGAAQARQRINRAERETDVVAALDAWVEVAMAAGGWAEDERGDSSDLRGGAGEALCSA